METVVEPKPDISKLWGKQKVKENEIYRLMKYVFRVDREDKVALYNVVSGQLVILDHLESYLLSYVPAKYSLQMKALIEDHFLVPVSYDEHKQVVNLRNILRKLQKSAAKSADTAIVHYTILPTTNCNARCYYCFQSGLPTATMTEQTADDVVRFISDHCGTKKSIKITWFGGEPTVASNRIDQISLGLRRNGIAFSSTMISNGYLFDEEMVVRAKKLWNLDTIHITVDGTEDHYNRIKNYSNTQDNPYQRVLHNVGLLVDQQIHVNLRMNFDMNNFMDFADLVDEVIERYHNNSYLHVCIHPVVGAYPDYDGNTQHGDSFWFNHTIVELHNIARDAGIINWSDKLPSLEISGCQAMSDTFVTITPQGSLVKCPEQVRDDQAVGNIKDGVTNYQLVECWKAFSEYENCIECVFFPHCIRVSNCNVKDRCNYKLDRITKCRHMILQELHFF